MSQIPISTIATLAIYILTIYIQRKIYKSNMTKIKNDIFDKPPIKSSPVKYHKWIDTEIINVLPLTYTPNHFEFDVENNTKDYIKCMCYMNEYFEKNNLLPIVPETAPLY